ncbi:MAG: serine/threonine protein kinase [Deltaproteobacteria bacterium]|nr:serine/threonine protein kinase [Deltaproteobacteria bacterium]
MTGEPRHGVSKDPFEPTAFGRYMLVDHLATGGMAEIFKASASGAHGFHKTLVIKRILPRLAEQPDFVAMFVEEAKVMVQLSHSKIVQLLDFGEVDGHLFIAMEYVDGVDGLGLLRQCAKKRLRPTTGIAVHIACEILDALDYAHTLRNVEGKRLGIIHRDISPSNIFISRHGEVKLGDFGIAQPGDPDQAGMVSLRGKYGYMSPEQVSGRPVDQQADIFAVGTVLAELLMVRRLFLADSDIEILLKVRDARIDRLERYGQRIPAELKQILDAALARDPAMRYQSAAAFRDVLQRYLFDSRRLVRSGDVRSFLERIGEGPRRQMETGPPQPAVRANRTAADVGRKRRIRLQPPPTPKPLPVVQTSEEGRIATEDALAALAETSRTASVSGGREFSVPPSITDPGASQPGASQAGASQPGASQPGASQAGALAAAAAAELGAVAEGRMTPIVGIPGLPPPDVRGKLGDAGEPSVVQLLFHLAADEETGLLLLEREGEVKEIFLVDGDPRTVASNRGDELFGQYLVRKKVLTNGELSMALAMLSHFDGRLGDTLVALKLLKPVNVIRHLTHQVRQKLLEVFAWDHGNYFYYRGRRSASESAPLGLDAFELLGAGVSQMSLKVIEDRLTGFVGRCLRPVVPAPVPPEIFRLGRLPRQVYEKFTGNQELATLLAFFDDDEAHAAFLRMTFLLMETGLLVTD